MWLACSRVSLHFATLQRSLRWIFRENTPILEIVSSTFQNESKTRFPNLSAKTRKSCITTSKKTDVKSGRNVTKYTENRPSCKWFTTIDFAQYHLHCLRTVRLDRVIILWFISVVQNIPWSGTVNSWQVSMMTLYMLTPTVFRINYSIHLE